MKLGEGGGQVKMKNMESNCEEDEGGNDIHQESEVTVRLTEWRKKKEKTVRKRQQR